MTVQEQQIDALKFAIMHLAFMAWCMFMPIPYQLALVFIAYFLMMFLASIGYVFWLKKR